MKYHQLRSVLEESSLSPEQIAPYLGVGSMTLRRWKKEKGSKDLPLSYERSTIEGIYQLIIQGHLSADSVAVQEVIKDSTSLSFQAVLKGLGVSAEFSEEPNTCQEERATVALFQIGSSDKRKNEVDESKPLIQSFKKMGKEWSKRITLLSNVVQSTKLTTLEKMVAYGALFYLISPFDLIPDHIPVIGLIDDFGILGFAITYYLNKFPEGTFSENKV